MIGVRKKLEKGWFSLLLFGFICIGFFRVFQNPQRKPGFYYHERQLKGLGSEVQTNRVRYATDWDAGRDGRDRVLFFNRVPKAGSEMLVLLLQWLQGVNGFRHVRLPGGEKRRLNLVEQVKRGLGN